VSIRLRLLALVLLPLLAACSQKEETGLAGTLLFHDRPLAGAQLEVYLKQEKDRATLPFTAVATDAQGRYRVTVPPGRYFLIGKKKEEGEGGHTRMLMAECPANPLEVTAGIRQVPAFSLREMGRDGALVPEAGTGIGGRVVAGGQPLAQAYVYVYTEGASGLMGPSYGEAVQTGADGRFHLELPAGRYYLAARKRADGSRMGEPAAGDLNGSYPGNPVSVPRGQVLELGDFPVRPVDAGERQARLSQGKFARTETVLRGRTVDQDGKPVRRIYVYGYLDSRMVGKPTYISAPTGEDGVFVLYLGSGGTYYVGARSTYGGPLEPGEWVGTFDGRPDHGVTMGRGEERALGDIVVREVW
jgi:hypothetical protein